MSPSGLVLPNQAIKDPGQWRCIYVITVAETIWLHRVILPEIPILRHLSNFSGRAKSDFLRNQQKWPIFWLQRLPTFHLILPSFSFCALLRTMTVFDFQP